MPIIASFIRIIIMAAVTAIPITLIQEFLDGTIKKLVEEIQSQNGLTLDEAKDIVANIVIDYLLNVAVIATAIKSKAGVKVAEYLGFTSKGYAKRILTPKAAQVSASITGSGGLVLLKSFGKKILGFLAGIGGLVWLVKALADIIEPGIYKPEQTNAIYEKLGIPFQYPTGIKALQPGPFDSQQFQDYANSLEAAGIKGFENPGARQTQLYNRENLANLIEYVYGLEVMNGNAPSSKEMIPILAPYLFGGSANSVSSGENKNVKTTGTLPQTPYTQINIENLPFGQIIVPPLVVEKITNAEELKDAIKSTIAQFANQIPNRLSFEIQLVRFWVDPQGQMITPNPPVYIERVRTSSGESTKTVQNKIVVLSVYFTTHEAKRVKIYAWPLDYSVADSIITSAPEGSTNPIPITIDVVKQIISQPPVVTTPQTPISATPATVVAPSAQIPGTGIQSSPAQPQTSVLTAVNYTSNDPYTKKLQALDQSRTLADLISILGFSIPAGYTQDDPGGTLFGFIKNQASGGGIASVNSQFIENLFSRYGKKETDKIDKRIFPLTVTVLSDVLLVRAAPNTASALAGSQRLLKGMQFIAVDAVIGENVNGQPWWWKSQVGNYVWSGGTDEGR